ncbi:UV-stimulated scaffold protein A isoform X2 [Dipodomys spectabilis]|uniref:UV-stimulated scaffold protein A isoform X2 n=1 Tax=Dipodomys spectabilis TaxID=105255 RepID=UPI001C5382B1|nr:UV-stimulated scaffold protein A isoform X2 [Dipodomys spectabilis]
MRQKLAQLVEELTTSGEPRLNPGKMKDLKRMCRSSEEQLSHAYHQLMTQLSQDHAEIRLSAFQVVNELFTRSHQFRTLLVSDFQEFLELTLGTDPGQPLPPPKEAAQQLRQAALRAVEGWNETFGKAYKKLALGYHFLRHTKKVDFQDVDARTLAERKREEEKQKHLDRIYRARAEQAEAEMKETSEEIRCCLTEVENCFRLLVPLDFGPCPAAVSLSQDSERTEEGAARSPSPGQAARGQAGSPSSQDDEQPCCSRALLTSAHPGATRSGEGPPQTEAGSPSEDEEEDTDSEEFLRSHGLGSHKYTLAVELSSDDLKVRESEDNLAVLHAARDALKLIRNKFLPAVCSWIQRFTRAGIHSQHLKCAIDLKMELELALRKCEELNIELGQKDVVEDLEDREEEDDEDFEEVPEKEGYEPHIPDHLRAACGLTETLRRDTAAATATQPLQARVKRSEEAPDPTSAAAQPWRLPDRRAPPPPSAARAPLGPEAQRLAAERARAPVVPFGADLCNWGQEQPVAGKILKSKSQHRFWKPHEVEEETDSADVSEVLRSRHITFAGTFEPVQHRCRALRPDGRLCERQDRLKDAELGVQEGQEPADTAADTECRLRHGCLRRTDARPQAPLLFLGPSFKGYCSQTSRDLA